MTRDELIELLKKIQDNEEVYIRTGPITYAAYINGSDCGFHISDEKMVILLG